MRGVLRGVSPRLLSCRRAAVGAALPLVFRRHICVHEPDPGHAERPQSLLKTARQGVKLIAPELRKFKDEVVQKLRCDAVRTAGDVVAVLRAYAPLILADLGAYAVRSPLIPVKRSYRLFNREYEILSRRILPTSASERYADRFEINNYTLHCTYVSRKLCGTHRLHTQVDLLMSLRG